MAPVAEDCINNGCARADAEACAPATVPLGEALVTNALGDALGECPGWTSGGSAEDVGVLDAEDDAAEGELSINETRTCGGFVDEEVEAVCSLSVVSLDSDRRARRSANDGTATAALALAVTMEPAVGIEEGGKPEDVCGEIAEAASPTVLLAPTVLAVVLVLLPKKLPRLEKPSPPLGVLGGSATRIGLLLTLLSTSAWPVSMSAAVAATGAASEDEEVVDELGNKVDASEPALTPFGLGVVARIPVPA